MTVLSQVQELKDFSCSSLSLDTSSLSLHIRLFQGAVSSGWCAEHSLVCCHSLLGCMTSCYEAETHKSILGLNQDASGDLNVTPEVNSNTPAAAAYRPSHFHVQHSIIPMSCVGFWSCSLTFLPTEICEQVIHSLAETIPRILWMLHDPVVFSPFPVAAASIATFGTEPSTRLLISSAIKKKKIYKSFHHSFHISKRNTLGAPYIHRKAHMATDYK